MGLLADPLDWMLAGCHLLQQKWAFPPASFIDTHTKTKRVNFSFICPLARFKSQVDSPNYARNSGLLATVQLFDNDQSR